MEQRGSGRTQWHLRGECQPVCSIDMAGLAAARTRSGAATGHREGNGEARSRGRGRRRRRERIPDRRQGRKGSTQPGLRPLLRNVPREPAALGAAAHRAIAQSTADRDPHMLPRGGVSNCLSTFPTCSVLSHRVISHHHATLRRVADGPSIHLEEEPVLAARRSSGLSREGYTAWAVVHRCL